MSIRELSEEAVWEIAENELGPDEDWPVLFKKEWDATESAVCLKQTRSGYVLAASCDRDDAIRFFFSEDREAMSALAQRFSDEMEASGNPLSGAVDVADVTDNSS